MTESNRPNSSGTWVLWLLIIGLVSLVIALVVGILQTWAGARLPEATMAAGAAFGVSVGLCLAVLAAVRELRGSL
ncbi:hypothetical protein [Kitasatospora sp. NPDC056531]|uniref:hypothetical protein n=1 Tax=Kitasatospora sp. NPDC056531 TaxID=3345856 RepID=UPI0036D08B54